jgi:hypothetical protein
VGLPGEFHVASWAASGGYANAARFFQARSISNYIICIVVALYT